MKRTVSVVVLLLAAHLLLAQVVLRNDFIIDKKAIRLHNKGLTFVTVNMGSRSNWNLNAYGQPVKAMVVDVKALRGKKDFTYREIIEKLYRPMAVYKQAYIPIPLFLLLEPQRRMSLPTFAYNAQQD